MIVLHCVVSCVCILQLISNINLTNKTSSCQSLRGQDGGPFKDLSGYIPRMLYCDGVGDPDPEPALLSIKPTDSRRYCLYPQLDCPICVQTHRRFYTPHMQAYIANSHYIKMPKCGASHHVVKQINH